MSLKLNDRNGIVIEGPRVSAVRHIVQSCSCSHKNSSHTCLTFDCFVKNVEKMQDRERDRK